jgi:hypothetical protein
MKIPYVVNVRENACVSVIAKNMLNFALKNVFVK